MTNLDAPPPHPEPTFHLADMAAPRRRRTGPPIIATICGVLVLLTAVAGGSLALADREQPQISGAAMRTATPASPPAPSPSVSPSDSPLPPLDERATCRVLVPALGELATAASALAHDGVKPDVERMKDVERRLRSVRDRAPQDMRSDIDATILAATTMQVGNLDGTAVSAPGARLLMRCRQYAR